MADTTYEPIPENQTEPTVKGDLYLLKRELTEQFEKLPTKEDFSQLLDSVDKLAGQVQTSNTPEKRGRRTAGAA